MRPPFGGSARPPARVPKVTASATGAARIAARRIAATRRTSSRLRAAQSRSRSARRKITVDLARRRLAGIQRGTAAADTGRAPAAPPCFSSASGKTRPPLESSPPVWPAPHITRQDVQTAAGQVPQTPSSIADESQMLGSMSKSRPFERRRSTLGAAAFTASLRPHLDRHRLRRRRLEPAQHRRPVDEPQRWHLADIGRLRPQPPDERPCLGLRIGAVLVGDVLAEEVELAIGKKPQFAARRRRRHGFAMDRHAQRQRVLDSDRLRRDLRFDPESADDAAEVDQAGRPCGSGLRQRPRASGATEGRSPVFSSQRKVVRPARRTVAVDPADRLFEMEGRHRRLLKPWPVRSSRAATR